MTVIIGLPNAGKTTYSNQYSKVLHYDDISRYTREERAEIYKAFDGDCIEGIYNTRESRERLLSCLTAEKKICVWIDTPADVCKQRESRGRGLHLVESHSRMFEPPSIDEGWSEIVRITYKR